MLERIYRLSGRARLVARDDGWWLRCDHPLQAVRLNEGAARLVAALDGATALHALLPGAGREQVAFLERQTARGLLRASYRAVPPADPPRVEVIVPVHAADPAPLAACLAGLARQTYPPDRFRVTVSDDASPVDLAVALGPLPPGPAVRWLRRGKNRGPASARNTAALAPHPEATPLLAFLDSDCVPEPDWLARLVAVVDDPALDVAGGAVRGVADGSLLGRYEGRGSPLYLGPRPGAVAAPEAPLAYLPATNLVLRRRVFAAVGGFREGLRVGEDVDLCWRLAAAGAGLFYWPEAAVRHRHRTRWGAFLRRRCDYARSEGDLRERFPGRFRRAPAGAEGAALALAAAGLLLERPVLLPAALALPWLGAAWRTWRLRAALAGRPAGEAVPVALGAWLRLGAARLLHAARHATRRTAVLWLPGLALLPALWPLTAAVFALGALGEALARPPGRQAAAFLPGFAADALGYSAGLAGLILRRLVRPLRWPGPRRKGAGGT